MNKFIYAFLLSFPAVSAIKSQTLQQVTQNGSVTSTGITESSFTANAESTDGTIIPTNITALSGFRINGNSCFASQNGITFQSCGGGGAGIGFYRGWSFGTGIDFYTNSDTSHQSGIITHRMRIGQDGNVGIGTANPTAKLTVAGNIQAWEIKVSVDAGADYVLKAGYGLKPLPEVEEFIKTNHHLPEIAPAVKMEKDGMNLSEMNIQLLKKIEELTLYIINQDKRIQKLEKKAE